MLNIDLILKEELEKIDLKKWKHRDIDFHIKIVQAQSFLGQCVRYNKTKARIKLSTMLLKYGTEQEIRETIMHELLHATLNTKGHDTEWYRKANIINNEYDYHIARTSSLQNYTKDEGNFKYCLVCKKCGQKIFRNKMSVFVRNPNHFSCGKCGGKFERVK
jgi:predicted SprT family Zn-dependent metalloprotease